MSRQHLHPEVEAFKQFINKHPQLLIEIRKSGQPIQSYYERWEKNKEADPLWRDYSKPTQQKVEHKQSNESFLDHITALSQYIDLNKVAHYVNQFQQALQTAQLFLNEEQKQPDKQADEGKQNSLFHIFRD